MDELVFKVREYAGQVGVSFDVALNMLRMANEDIGEKPLYWVCQFCGESERSSCHCGDQG